MVRRVTDRTCLFSGKYPTQATVCCVLSYVKQQSDRQRDAQISGRRSPACVSGGVLHCIITFFYILHCELSPFLSFTSKARDPMINQNLHRMKSKNMPSNKRKQNDSSPQKQVKTLSRRSYYNTRSKVKPSSVLCELVYAEDWRGASLRIESNPKDAFWVDGKNNTILHHICACSHVPEYRVDKVAKVSMPARINIIRKIAKIYPEAATHQNSIGRTPFHTASENHYKMISSEMLEILWEMMHYALMKKVRVLNRFLPLDIQNFILPYVDSSESTLSIRDQDGLTALDYAVLRCRTSFPDGVCRKGWFDKVDFLLRNSNANANFTQSLHKGGNPVHCMCRRLREYGFDFQLAVNTLKIIPKDFFRSRDDHGNTPLHCATADVERSTFSANRRRILKPLDEFNIVLLARAYPEALEMHNAYGETPLSTNTVSSMPLLHGKLENILRASKSGNS